MPLCFACKTLKALPDPSRLAISNSQPPTTRQGQAHQSGRSSGGTCPCCEITDYRESLGRIAARPHHVRVRIYLLGIGVLVARALVLSYGDSSSRAVRDELWIQLILCRVVNGLPVDLSEGIAIVIHTLGVDIVLATSSIPPGTYTTPKPVGHDLRT